MEHHKCWSTSRRRYAARRPWPRSDARQRVCLACSRVASSSAAASSSLAALPFEQYVDDDAGLRAVVDVRNATRALAAPLPTLSLIYRRRCASHASPFAGGGVGFCPRPASRPAFSLWTRLAASRRCSASSLGGARLRLLAVQRSTRPTCPSWAAAARAAAVVSGFVAPSAAPASSTIGFVLCTAVRGEWREHGACSCVAFSCCADAAIAPRRLAKQVAILIGRFASHAPHFHIVIWAKQFALSLFLVALAATILRATDSYEERWRFLLAAIDILITLIAWYVHYRTQPPCAYRFQNSVESWLYGERLPSSLDVHLHTVLLGEHIM